MLLAAARWLAVLFPATLLAGPAVAEILGILIAVLFLVHTFRERDFGWLRARWVQLLLALCAVLTLSQLFAIDPLDGLKRGILYIRFPLLAAALAFWVLRDEATQRRVLLVLLLSVIALALDMLLQLLTGSDLFGRTYHQMIGFVRLTGPFSGPRPGITLVWIAFPAIFYAIDLVRRRAKPGSAKVVGYLACALLIGLVLAMIHASGERMALCYALFGLALAVLLARPVRWFFLAMVAVMLFAFTVGMIRDPQIIDRQVTRAAHEIANFDQSIYGRVWISAWRIAQDHPLTGVGIKQFRTVCPDPVYGSALLDAPAHRCAMHPHNFYVELLVETGAISLLLFLAVVASWLGMCWLRRRAVTSDLILCGLVITLLIRVWPLASTPSHFVPWFASPMWFFTGFLLAALSMVRPHAPR